MKTRIIAALLLLAIASMVTASPACASRPAATAPGCVVLDQPQRSSAGAAAGATVHDLVAILPASEPLPSRTDGSLRTATVPSGAVLERQPLLLVLRI